MISIAETRKRVWHHVRMDAPQLLEREHERMKLMFNWTWMAARRPQGMSLWMAPDDDGADLYLSPRSTPLVENIILRYQAQACDPPGESTVLIAGDGVGTYQHCARALITHTAVTNRRFLPAGYTHRSVRSLGRNTDSSSPAHTSDSMGANRMPADAMTPNQMTPFVRRFAQAWTLLSPPGPR